MINCCHKPVRCANVTASYLSRLWYRFHQLLQGNSSALLPPPREACAALAFRSVKKEIEVNIVVKIGAFLKRKNIAHTNWWRRKILKNLRWVFLEAPTKMKALTIFTAIQWTELIFAFELRLTKTVGKQPKKTRASRRILHVASWLDQVVFDQYLRGMGSRGVQALIFPGLSSAISFTAA